ncbi:MAG: single-stranded DNA-binding protein [Microbacterium sp.]
MTEILTIVGKVATDPTAGRTTSGVPVTNFRLASTHRRFDQATSTWVDGETNWFSVAAFRQLAEHARASLRTGDSVIVTGRLKIRNWEANGKHGTSVDIDADAIGHDLRWGTSSYMPRSRLLSATRGSDDDDQRTMRGDLPNTGSPTGSYPGSDTDGNDTQARLGGEDGSPLGDVETSWRTLDTSSIDDLQQESAAVR